MTDQTKVLKLALDLAEDARRYGDSNLARKAITTITALKTALADHPSHQEPICKLFGTLPVYDLPSKPKSLTDEQVTKMCPQFDDPMRREMWITGFKAAHGITGEQK